METKTTSSSEGMMITNLYVQMKLLYKTSIYNQFDLKKGNFKRISWPSQFSLYVSKEKTTFNCGQKNLLVCHSLTTMRRKKKKLKKNGSSLQVEQTPSND